MKATAIVFHASCQLSFEKEEIELLMKLSAGHYDAHCREVGQVGGFLYGLNNVYVLTEPLAIAASGSNHGGVTLNFREIDTLCKILEMARRYDYDRAEELSELLRDCLRRLNAVCGISQEIR